MPLDEPQANEILSLLRRMPPEKLDQVIASADRALLEFLKRLLQRAQESGPDGYVVRSAVDLASLAMLVQQLEREQ